MRNSLPLIHLTNCRCSSCVPRTRLARLARSLGITRKPHQYMLVSNRTLDHAARGYYRA